MTVQPRKKKGIFIATIVLLLIVLAISTKVFSTWQKTIVPPQRIATGDGSYVIATNIPHQMKFVSPKLGINFLYINEGGSRKAFIKEEDDKVYVYFDNEDYHKDGHYVQVFHKNPTINLETTIKRTILAGYNENDCMLKNITPPSPYSRFDEEFAIRVPNTSSLREDIENMKKCPAQYVWSNNGASYFAYDKKYPDKFLFFFVGQSNISEWDETLRFLP